MYVHLNLRFEEPGLLQYEFKIMERYEIRKHLFMQDFFCNYLIFYYHICGVLIRIGNIV